MPPPSVLRVDDELGGRVGTARSGDLGVPHEGAAIGIPEEVDDPVASRADGQPEGLGHGLDAVGLRRARPERPQVLREGRVHLEDALGARRHLRTRSR